MEDDTTKNETTEAASTKRSSKKKWLIVVPVVLLLGLGGVAAATFANPPKATVSADCNKPSSTEVTISYDGKEFSPACVSVKQGTKIVWKNEGAKELQVGVDPHPVHSGDKAVTNGEFVLKADPRASTKEVNAKVGTYGYHDHLNGSANAVLDVY